MTLSAMKNALRRVKVALGMERQSCTVCGRPLYAASSIIRGMGTTCAGRHAKKDTQTLDLFEPEPTTAIESRFEANLQGRY